MGVARREWTNWVRQQHMRFIDRKVPGEPNIQTNSYENSFVRSLFLSLSLRIRYQNRIRASAFYSQSFSTTGGRRDRYPSRVSRTTKDELMMREQSL